LCDNQVTYCHSAIREAIEAVRKALGRQLAALRQAAGYSQQEFNQAFETLATCQAS
jgi:hypothetical protein